MHRAASILLALAGLAAAADEPGPATTVGSSSQSQGEDPMERRKHALLLADDAWQRQQRHLRGQEVLRRAEAAEETLAGRSNDALLPEPSEGPLPGAAPADRLLEGDEVSMVIERIRRRRKAAGGGDGGDVAAAQIAAAAATTRSTSPLADTTPVELGAVASPGDQPQADPWAGPPPATPPERFPAAGR